MTDAVMERVARAKSLFVLTGAGISADSGLPTFRGPSGVWRNRRVEDLASPQGFERDPELVWTWYNERRAVQRAVRPNAGHEALVELEARYADFTLATQNVDSLHGRAGSRDVLELHGNLREARCERCGKRRSLDEPLPRESILHACGGRFRPDVVWFGEPLPQAVWDRAAAAAARADVLLVIGTSGMVHPAASLATRFPGPDAYVVEINPEPTAVTASADVRIAGTAAAVLPQLLGMLATSAAPIAAGLSRFPVPRSDETHP